jgi:hypothetical protein
VELIGAKLDAINKAEDRDLFKKAMVRPVACQWTQLQESFWLCCGPPLLLLGFPHERCPTHQGSGFPTVCL